MIPDLRPTSDGLFARRLLLHTGGPLLLASDGDRKRLAEALAEELDLDDIAAIPVETDSGPAVLDALEGHPEAIVFLIVTAADASGPGFWRWLDANRSRLGRDRPYVFLVTTAQAQALGRFGPNLKSWIGGAAWRHHADALTPEERARRLERLRARYGLDDAQLIARAEQGRAPPDPEVGAWLLLIGRGDLIGR